jgi:adenosine deaminase
MCKSLTHLRCGHPRRHSASKANSAQKPIVMAKGPQESFVPSNPNEITLSRKDFTKFVQQMPKIQLHDHLEGSVRPQTILEEADRLGIPRPADNVEEMSKMVSMQPGEGLIEFLTKFDKFRFIFDDEQSLARISYENVEDSKMDGVDYLEVRMNCQKNQDKLSIGQVMDAVLDGMHKGSEDFGVETRFIASINRSFPPADAMNIVKAAIERKDRGVVGIDLAGNERDYPPELFTEVFAYARENGLQATVHAGEAAGPESIEGAIDALGAERIGHGVRLRDDKELMSRVRDEDIHIEMCPHSNLLINVVDGMKDYPIREYHNHGISTSLSTDDQHIFGTTLVKEYTAMSEHNDFTLQEFQEMNVRGLEHAFLPQADKNRLIAKFTTEYKAINREISSQDRSAEFHAAQEPFIAA